MNSLVPTNGGHHQPAPAPASGSRYENQKRRDWNTFGQYLRSQYKPPLSPSECSGAHVIDFMRYLDQFGKTKVHSTGCPFFGLPSPPSPCPCPLRQAWGSLDSLVGRLRAAFDEHNPAPSNNPFAARAVRVFLREVRDVQSKARGVCYDKKKKKNKSRASSSAPDDTAATSSAVVLQPTPGATWVTGQYYW